MGKIVGLRRILVVLIYSLSLAACGKPDLPRQQAAAQIEASEEVGRLSLNIPLHSQAILKGETQGIWTLHNLNLILSNRATALIERADRNTLVLRKPAVIRVQVTGIADVPSTNNLKEAQFTWTYSELPSLIKRFAIHGGSGRAVFRLFDDGWRVDNITASSSGTPIALSPTELAEERADAGAEAERRRQEAEAREAEVRRIARAIKEAKTPTKTILDSKQVLRTWSGVREHTITITDASIRFRCTSYNCDEDHDVWFGHVRGVGAWEGYIQIALRNSYWEYGLQSSILVPVALPDEREKLVQIVNAEIDAWRSRFATLPAQAFEPRPAR